MREAMRKSARGILAAAVLISSAVAAVAKDLNRLAKFVRPAYTAMNFAVMCARDNPFFLADTSGPRGTPLHYAEHVKNEAINGLSEADAITVLKIAAGAARTTARRQLYGLAHANDDRGTAQAVRDWCDSSGKDFVLDFIRQHDVGHSQVIESLQRAKQ